MSFMNPKTQAMFRWAKRSARGQRRPRVAIADVVCALRQVASEGLAGPELKDAFKRLPVEILWPLDVEDLGSGARAVAASDIDAQKLPLDEPLARVIEVAHRADPTLPLGQLLKCLLEAPDPLVVEWLRLNGLGPAKSAARAPAKAGAAAATETSPSTEAAPDPPQDAVATAADRLEDAAQGAALLRRALGKEVLGQDAAIEMLAGSYFLARLLPPASGPRGVFTFLGPTGVGKTMLAERFAAELGKLERRPLAFKRFDMGSYAGHQNFEQLFGAEQFYKGNRPGTLTGFVHANPRCVLLFDEIEKAHENTIQALLAVLDKGVVDDKNLEKPVQFNHAWIVFTTNLGREFFDSESETGVLRDAGLSSAAVFDLLRSARGRLSAGDDEAPAALSAEFVSRLAKGGAVVFNRLETGHYLELVRRGFVLGETDSEDGLPALRATDEACLLFLMSLLPELDARRVVSSARAWAADTVRAAWEHGRAEVRASAATRFAVVVRCADEARAFLDAELRSGAPMRVLFVDDDAHLSDAVAREYAGGGVTIERIEKGDDALRTIARARASALFLDLSLAETPSSSRVESALSVLEGVRRRFPGLPVYLFSENPQDRGAFDEVVGRILQAGGARGFLACRRDASNPLLIDDFALRARAAIEEVRRSEVVRRHARARQRVVFRTSYHWDEASATLAGQIHGVATEVVVDARDQSAAIRFAGIPRERFDDVAGLERAKRRLSEVVGWLARPEVLAALGVNPPRGFLLAGPPGTGKTLLARAFAGEAGLPFLALAAGELRSKWHGESEERVRDLFDRARRYAPSIVFIDEIDAVGSRRRDEMGTADGSLLNQILACMDGFRPSDRPVFVLAATNREGDLDPALKRPGRFDEVIPIDLPNAGARQDFFERRLKDLPVAAGIDLGSLVRSTSGCAPAELDRIVREAAYRAAAGGRETIEAKDLEEASRLVRFGASLEGEKIAEDETRRTAWHEAGHAVAYLALHPGAKVEWVTVIPSESGALGFAAYEADETKKDISAEDVRRRLAVLFAGRGAECLLAGDERAVTAGAASDLRSATKLARSAVANWGFDETFGSVAVDALRPDERAAVAPRLEERIRFWLDEGRELARKTLEENREALAAVATALQEAEALDGEALETLFQRAVVERET